MSFDSLQGAPTVRASKEFFTPLEKKVNGRFEKEEYELEKSRIADIALAVGLVENERAQTSGPTFTFNLGSIDKYGVLKGVIQERHQDKEGDELRVLLQRYMEGGAQFIADEIDENGVFNYHRYLSEEK